MRGCSIYRRTVFMRVTKRIHVYLMSFMYIYDCKYHYFEVWMSEMLSLHKYVDVWLNVRHFSC